MKSVLLCSDCRQGVDRQTGRKVAIKACSKKVLSTRPARISKVSEIHALQKVWYARLKTRFALVKRKVPI